MVEAKVRRGSQNFGVVMDCSFDGCDNDRHAQGLCGAHYMQRRRGEDLRPLKKSATDRYWSYVVKGGSCWGWSGAKTRGGYGDIHVNGKMIKAHRFSYELHFGSIPDGMVVRHMCNNPECTNPDHLKIGTQADNMSDAIESGRIARGGRHPNVKLSIDDILSIRNDSRTNRAIAAQYKVDSSTISDIKNRKTWRWVT